MDTKMNGSSHVKVGGVREKSTRGMRVQLRLPALPSGSGGRRRVLKISMEEVAI